MITEEQALRLLSEANPIPDVDSLDLPLLGDITDLEGLELRSTTVIDTDIKPREASKRGTAVRWLTAAMILLIAGLAFILVSRPRSEIAEPTPTTTEPVELCQTSDPACRGPLAPGTHTTHRLLTPVTFDVPEGWSKGLDVEGSVNLDSVDFPGAVIAIIPDWAIASQQECSREPEPGLGRSVDDLVTFLAEHPGLVTSTPTPVTLGGLEGQTLDVRTDPDSSGPCLGEVNLFTHRSTINDAGWWRINDSTRLRLYVLDRGDGHTVMAMLETLDEETFEEFVAAATPIVESFVFISGS